MVDNSVSCLVDAQLNLPAHITIHRAMEGEKSYSSPEEWSNGPREISKEEFDLWSAELHEATQHLIDALKQLPDGFPNRTALSEAVKNLCSLLPVLEEE